MACFAGVVPDASGIGGGSPRPNSGGGPSFSGRGSRVVTPPTASASKLPRVGPRRGQQKQGASVAGRDVALAKIAPIWLGSGSKEEDIPVKDIRMIVPEDMYFNESVLAIERFESDAIPYEANQKYVMAAECYEQAINLRRKFLGDLHQDFLAAIERYVVCCNLWGMYCLNSGQYTVSLELLKKAEAMTEAENVPNFKRRVSLRAATFSNLCCYFRHRGKLNAALQFAEKALKLEQRYKDAENPARTHLNYAVLLSMMGRHEEAVEHIESAIAVLHDEERQISYESHDSHDADAASGAGAVTADRKKYHEVVSVLVVAYYNMWVELTRLSRRELGLEFILRAANIAKRKLGPTHLLTLKTEESLGIVQEYMTKTPTLTHHLETAFGPAPQLDGGAAAGTFAEHGSRPGTNSSQLPPLESRVPWTPRKPESFIDALAAHNVTVRYETPRRPSSRPPGGKKPFQRNFKTLNLQEHIYGRFMQPIPPEAAETLNNAARPKLSSAKADHSSFSGSPILQQQAYGTTPRVLSSRSGRDGASSGLGFSATDPGVGMGTSGAGLNVGEASTTPPKSFAEASLTANLRAAYDHYRTRQQQKEGLSGEVALPLESERLGAIGVFRLRLDQRRERGLQVPTDCRQARAATKIQALVRGYLVRLWDVQELAHDSRRRRESEQETSTEQSTPADQYLPDEFAEQLTSADAKGPPDMKRRVALRVVYAARRAFVEYKAALAVQRAWRGFITRRDIGVEVGRMVQQTATKLQALFRRAIVCSRISLAHGAAIAIQGPWRRWIARRTAKARRQSARRITCAARRYVVRRRLRARHDIAVPLQRSVRGFLDRRRLELRQDGALRFQKAYRGWSCRRRIELMHTSASRIAGLVRGHLARRRSQRMHLAAREIQRRFRGHRIIRKVLAMQVAASRIGAAWRGYKGRKSRPYRCSVCKVQANVRGVQERGRLRKKPWAALRIQAFWRSYRARQRFKTSVSLGIVLQKLARWQLVQRKLRRHAAATVLCQRTARAHRTRNAFRHRTSCATRIQANWRSSRRRCRIMEASTAAQVIQKMFRGFVKRRRYRAWLAAAYRIQAGRVGYIVRQRSRRQRAAALRVGTAYRGHLCRRRLHEAHQAATRNQTWWRRCHAARAKRRVHAAATRIQATYRCRLQRGRFVALRLVAGGLQKVWRKRAARRRWLNTRRLVVALQACWRGRAWRGSMAKQHIAATSLQAFWKLRRQRQLLQKQTMCATRLQLAFIAVLERRQQCREWEAAVLIQRNVRGCSARKHCKLKIRQRRLVAWMRGRIWRMRYSRTRRAALTLQSGCRAWLSRRRISRSTHAERTIEAYYMMWKITQTWRRRSVAVTVLQRAWRGYAARAHLRRRLEAAVNIQRVARGKLAVRAVQRRRQASVFIQKMWRGYKQARRLKALKLMSILVSAGWKAYFAFKYELTKKRRAARCILRFSKIWLVRIRIKRSELAASTIQRFARGRLARRRVHFIKNIAPLPIQNFVRRRIAVRHTERLRMQAYLEKERGIQQRMLRRDKRRYAAATRIQACQRMRMERNKYQFKRKFALPRIQAFNRMIIERENFGIYIKSAIAIQKFVRAFILPKIDEEKQAASIIQSGVRHYLAHKCANRAQFNDYIEQTEAARVIQACWRRYQQRWRYMRKIVGAVRIQAAVRMFLVRRRWQQKKAAAVRIQVSFMKVCLAYNAVQARREYVKRVQALAIGGITRNHLRRNLNRCIAIQAAWRSALGRQRIKKRQYQAAVKIQANMRLYYHKNLAYPKRLKALTSIQAHARGFLVRKHLREQHAAARRIQQKVRLTRFRLVMSSMKWLVLSLQRIFRGGQSRMQTRAALLFLRRFPARARGRKFRRQEWPALVAGAIGIQRIYRGHLSRGQLARRHRAATTIQASWRAWLAKRDLKKVKSAVTSTSAAFLLVRNNDDLLGLRNLYLTAQEAYAVSGPNAERDRARKAATTLQRFARGMLSRHAVWRMLDAAIKIQGMVRRANARSALARRRRALMKIQAHLDGAYQRTTYPTIRAKVVLIQALIKMRFARQMYLRQRDAQKTIARIARGISGRRHARELRRGSATVNSRAKGMAESMRYMRLQRAARHIQAFWRGWLARDEIQSWPRLATTIATAWRRSRARRRHLEACRAGTVIVSAAFTWRLARSFQSQRRAVTKIAAAWHAYCVRREIEHRQNAATKIQTGWRHVLEMRAYQEMCVEVLVRAKIIRDDHHTSPALVIQRCFRAWHRRKHATFPRQRRAAIRIQTFFRRLRAEDSVERLRDKMPVRLARLLSRPAVLLPDRSGRLTRSREVRVNEDLPQRPHIVRPIVCVHHLPERQRKAISDKIYAFQTMARWLHYVTCITTVQRHWRGHLCRRWLAMRGRAAVVIQAFWRSSRAQRRKSLVCDAATRVEASVRGFLERARLRRAIRAFNIMESPEAGGGNDPSMSPRIQVGETMPDAH